MGHSISLGIDDRHAAPFCAERECRRTIAERKRESDNCKRDLVQRMVPDHHDCSKADPQTETRLRRGHCTCVGRRVYLWPT